MDGNYTNSYWLGGVDYFQEGTWQWASGDPWGFESWHEGEPNNVDNEVSRVMLMCWCSPGCCRTACP